MAVFSYFFKLPYRRQKKACSRHKTELNFVEGSGKLTQPLDYNQFAAHPERKFLLFYLLFHR
jgi:hypothetical protein